VPRYGHNDDDATDRKEVGKEGVGSEAVLEGEGK
jgi:hypothetical protein